MEMSEHKAAEHEPFNWAAAKPRQFWPIMDAWRNTENAENLCRALQKILDERYLIKHCYELHPAGFNRRLMEVAAKTPYRHILLLRRDEYARLISKFIAEGQGTWFKDYARQVFSEVAEGRRKLEPLPTDRMVAHYQRCRDATRAIRTGLTRVGLEFKEIYYEELYSGSEASRLANTQALLDFLGFTHAEIEQNASLVDQKIFHSGQDTPAVAPFVPNLQEVTEALAAQGCFPLSSSEPDPRVESEAGPTSAAKDSTEKGNEMAIQDAPAADHASSTGPRAKLRAELQHLVQSYDARGPVLEIAVDVRDLAVPSIEHFHGEQRHVIGLGGGVQLEGVTSHASHPHDMRGLFADGSVGTVISNKALAHDPMFWQTVDEIRRVLVPGGLASFVTPCFSKAPNEAGVIAVGRKGNPVADVTVTYRVHASPDFWRISPQAMKNVILAGFDVQEVRVKMMPPYVFGVGIKSK
jgi:hypothetical protein